MSALKNNLQIDGNLNRLWAFRKSDDFDWQLAEHFKMDAVILKDAEAVEIVNKSLGISALRTSALCAAMSMLITQQQLNGATTIPTENFQNHSKWILETGNLNSLQSSARIQFPQVDTKPIDVDEESKTESADKAELETIFNGLAKNWREATGGYSLTMRRYAHTSYQQILALEPKKDVISLILRELQQRPDRWFEALKALTKANPAQDSKTFDETVQRWIDWGTSGKYIS